MRKKKQFYIAGKDEIKDETAPVVGGEFITEDNTWQGQTVQVQSETHLEDDHGIGDTIILRTFEFALNPETFGEFEKRNGRLPTAEEIFQDQRRGIVGMLWQDGLTPAEDIEPRVIISKGAFKYLIIVGARPQLGQAVLDKPQTLSEIVHDPRKHKDKIH